VRPEDVPVWERGVTAEMAVHMMDLVGHDWRGDFLPQQYLEGRAVPSWPERCPLVSAMPMAFFRVQWQKDDEDRAMRASAAAFCGGLHLADIMESAEYLR
jgi:hypothetical protein